MKILRFKGENREKDDTFLELHDGRQPIPVKSQKVKEVKKSDKNKTNKSK